MEEAIVKLKKCNKLIKLKDKLQAGWYFAEEYEIDNLASDWKDEKKIKRAERSPMAKRKVRPSTSIFIHPPSTQSSLNHLFHPQWSGTEAFTQQSSTTGVTHEKNKQGDQCFGYGKSGHWRRECRAQQNFHVNPQFSSQHSCRVSKTNNQTLHHRNSKTKKSSSLKSIEAEYNLDSFDGDRDKLFIENERVFEIIRLRRGSL